MNTEPNRGLSDKTLQQLRELSRPALMLVHLLIHALLFKEWIATIPQRWLMWQIRKGGKR